MSLKMTQFSIGTSVYEQIRGSPMGSPLSPALCMMVVALSEEIWYRTYQTTLSTMDLSARLLRYVDNRLCLADPSWDYDICFANFLRPEFYGHPIILETEPDQEFLGFCIEFEPFALRYSPPRDFNQVMAPFSASPLAVQLSGFVSRLFLVAKCAHPAQERTRGFAALHRLYRAAGFCESTYFVTVVKSVAASRSCVSVSRFTHRWMYHLFGQSHVSPVFVNDIPAGSPSNPCPFALSDVSSFARWLLLLLLRQFRFKNRFFSNFFTMYTMRIFYYIEQWPYSRRPSFPILNQHLYPAPTYGTNLMDFDHTTLTGPMPSSTQSTFLHLTLLRKKPLWMSCWNLIFQNHINTLLLLHLTPSQIHRSSQPPPRRLPNANRTPELLPRHLQNVVAVPTNRDPVPRAHCRPGLSKTNKNFVL